MKQIISLFFLIVFSLCFSICGYAQSEADCSELCLLLPEEKPEQKTSTALIPSKISGHSMLLLKDIQPNTFVTENYSLALSTTHLNKFDVLRTSKPQILLALYNRVISNQFKNIKAPSTPIVEPASLINTATKK